MKCLKSPLVSHTERICCVFLLFAGGLVLAPAGAQAAVTPFMLTDRNSTFSGDLGSIAGATSWTVDGANQLARQWFWVQTAGGSPQDLSTLTTTPVVTTLGTKQLTATYNNNTSPYGAQLSYTLTGSSLGGQSKLNETLTLYNNTASSQQFSLFMYSDFLLRGAAGQQNVRVGALDGTATVTQDLGTFMVATNSFVAIGGASRAEVAANPQTLNELLAPAHLVLNNNLIGGPGNYTWALEWDLTIAPNSSAQISMLDTLVVPEPSSVAVLMLGVGAWFWRRVARKC